MALSLLPLSALLLLCFINFTHALSPAKKSRVSFVTGANGYLGREIVHELLDSMTCTQQEHIVCLVRACRVPDEIIYWKHRGSDCVSVYAYDMLDGGRSIMDALTAVPAEEAVVYHTASVFGPTPDHTQTALDNVRGVEDMVQCLAKFPNAKLVLTSSMAAVRATGQMPQNMVCYSHLDWNSKSELGVNWGSSYQWSKAQSERRAWKLSQEHNVPMVALCPSFIFGPSRSGSSDSKSYSQQLIRQWILGESKVQSRLCVDVRDVAKAHVAAGTIASAVGQRFVVSSECRLRSTVLAEILKEIAPSPEKISVDDAFDGGSVKIGDREVLANARLKEMLGIELTPISLTFRDMGAQLCVEAVVAELPPS